MSALPSSPAITKKLCLADLSKGQQAIVQGLADASDAGLAALRMRLFELGFAPGEEVHVVAESFPRGDPMAVRIGNTTFALRRREAALIFVTPS